MNPKFIFTTPHHTKRKLNMKNPTFEIVAKYSPLVHATISGMTIEWLYKNYVKTNDLESYICIFLVMAIEGSRRRNNGNILTVEDADFAMDVSAICEVSSAQVNYSLVEGLGLSAVGMASTRRIMREKFDVKFHRGCDTVWGDSESFSITLLIEYINSHGNRAAVRGVKPVFNKFLELDKNFWNGVSAPNQSNNFIQRKMILERIIEVNPGFEFPTLNFKYLVHRLENT